MKNIPKTVTADGAETVTEQAGQYREQLAAFNREVADYLDHWRDLAVRSGVLEALHECVQRFIEEDAIDFCESCDRFKDREFIEDGCCNECRAQEAAHRADVRAIR